ncbi:hypothetical protein Ancab_017057 [Ancistrocladus abbreviatus]
MDIAGCSTDNEIQVVAPVAGSATLVASAVGMDESGVMPSSPSQVDMSVLQELPEELRADILGLLPAHTRPSCRSDSPKTHQSFGAEPSTGSNVPAMVPTHNIDDAGGILLCPEASLLSPILDPLYIFFCNPFSPAF